MSSGQKALWVPEVDGDAAEARHITSAMLYEGGANDVIELYVLGELVTQFPVPTGAGEHVLAECGLRRVQP